MTASSKPTVTVIVSPMPKLPSATDSEVTSGAAASAIVAVAAGEEAASPSFTVYWNVAAVGLFTSAAGANPRRLAVMSETAIVWPTVIASPASRTPLSLASRNSVPPAGSGRAVIVIDWIGSVSASA